MSKVIFVKSFLTFSAFFLCTFVVQAQEQPERIQKEYHQIFLEEPLLKIKKVQYSDEEKGEIEFQLSEDGSAIYLINYDGSGGVKAIVIDAEGKKQEIIRSKCHIHSLPEL